MTCGGGRRQRVAHQEGEEGGGPEGEEVEPLQLERRGRCCASPAGPFVAAQVASAAEINEYLTFMCCFMDEDAGWAKKKASMAKSWSSKSPVADHIRNLMSDAQDMRKTLSRTPRQASL